MNNSQFLGIRSIELGDAQRAIITQALQVYQRNLSALPDDWQTPAMEQTMHDCKALEALIQNPILIDVTLNKGEFHFQWEQTL